MKPLPHWKRSWPDASEDLPVDILPASNGEYAPRSPTRTELEMMALANAETERWRRKFGSFPSEDHFLSNPQSIASRAIRSWRGGFGFVSTCIKTFPYLFFIATTAL